MAGKREEERKIGECEGWTETNMMSIKKKMLPVYAVCVCGRQETLMWQRGTQRKTLWTVRRDGQECLNQKCSLFFLSGGLPALSVCLFITSKLCFLYFAAPLTDKPPKILFPSENKISNMELQLGKSIMGFPPAAVGSICVISK